MSEITKNGKNLILENTIVSYSPKDDTIHITSADPDLIGEPFHISLNQSSPTENAIRKLLIQTGVIREDEIGQNLPEILAHPGIFNKNSSIFDLGVSRKGIVSWNTANNNPHLLIVGYTGSGKTVMLQNMVAQCSANKEEWNAIVFDFKGNEWKHFKNNNPKNSNFNLLTSAEELLEWLRKSDNHFNSESSKKQLLIIDGFYGLGDLNDSEKEECENLFFKILAMGRSKNIHVVISSQRSTLIDQKFINYLTSRIIMGKISEIESNLVIDSNIAVRTPKGAGRGIADLSFNEEPIQFQAYSSVWR